MSAQVPVLITVRLIPSWTLKKKKQPNPSKPSHSVWRAVQPFWDSQFLYRCSFFKWKKQVLNHNFRERDVGPSSRITPRIFPKNEILFINSLIESELWYSSYKMPLSFKVRKRKDRDAVVHTMQLMVTLVQCYTKG